MIASIGPKQQLLKLNNKEEMQKKSDKKEVR